jgi:hypothetical protein
MRPEGSLTCSKASALPRTIISSGGPTPWHDGCSGGASKTLPGLASDLRAALREEGLIRIRMTWLTCSSLWFDAQAGRKLKTLLRETKARSADDIYYDFFTRAARKIGLKPGIEDVYAHVDGQKVEGTVNTVPFAVTSAAVSRVVDHWRDQSRAKTARARKATT